LTALLLPALLLLPLCTQPCRPASYYKLGLHRHAKTVRELEAAAASK
jgi:hypothetical protein